MTPLHLAHALLSTHELLPILAEDARHPTAARARADGKDLNERLLDATLKAWDRRWGAEARHQAKGCRDLFAQQAAAGAPNGPLVLGALGLLAAELFTFHKGELRLDRAAHLSWRELWSSTTLLEPARAMAVATTCLKAEGARCWEPRALAPAQLQAALDAPALPPVDDAALERLLRDGLPEVHRHESLSKLPWYVWWRLLHADPTSAELPKGDAPTGEPWHRLLARAQRLWRAVEALCEPAPSPADEQEAAAALEPLLATDELGRWRKITGSGGQQPCLEDAERGRCVERTLLVRALQRLAGPAATSLLGHCLHALLILRGVVETSLLHPPQGYRGLDRFKEDFVDHALQWSISAPPAVLWTQAWEAGAVRWLEVKLGPGKGTNGLWEKTRLWLDAAREDEARGREIDAGDPGCAGPVPSVDRRGCAPCAADSAPDPLAGVAERLGTPAPRTRRPAIRAVLHFLRRADPEVDAELGVDGQPHWAGRARWARLRSDVTQQSRQLREILHHPVYGPFWVGIDAAAYELDAPAEVFAPAFRALRAPWAIALRDESQQPAKAFAMRALAASVHAGEEFTHLAQGMRWVDEHVRFLDLRQGDRIGHGLAVGIEPAWWRTQTTNRVVQRKQERLDDLVWLWSRLRDKPAHAHLCHTLADDARRLALEIYGRRADMGDLLEAWQLRDLDPELGQPEVDRDTGAVRLSPQLSNALDRAALSWQTDRLCQASPAAIGLWKTYTWDHGARRKGQQRTEVKVERKWDEPLRDVQNDQLAELAEKGIGLEANPSSNLAIAGLGKLERHPIFRWLPVKPEDRAGVPLPRVCVGSDDPAIFHTELLHEYALLIQAARETERFSERDIRLWVDELRLNGLDLWFDPVRPVGV
jgi:hypothetical protein